VLARERAQGSQELAPLWQQAMIRRHRLDNDGGDVGAFALEKLRDARLVIQRQHPRAGREGCGHAGRGRPAESGEP
jgi:hypothetical protein